MASDVLTDLLFNHGKETVELGSGREFAVED